MSVEHNQIHVLGTLTYLDSLDLQGVSSCLNHVHNDYNYEENTHKKLYSFDYLLLVSAVFSAILMWCLIVLMCRDLRQWHLGKQIFFLSPFCLR